jgi:nucleoside-diphosphate-sugar epimerase
MAELTPTLLCFGLGYSAEVLAQRLLARGWRIVGTSRKPEKRRELEAKGFTMHPFDRHHPLPASAFAGVTHVLTSIAPDEAGDPVLDLHGGDLRAAGLAWAGYLGTTAVYGDRGGDWVDETTPIDPTLARADRRARAEAAWLASGLPVHIFRLAGIYGPAATRSST